ncbi:TPA: hypothetical protein IF930_004335 [Escherichia coli]|uniref:Rha family transcriptional regulator n=1 Tax=Escherichia coli TaxID=562 RepID=UPI0010AC9387|nr:Rha family transcriptional regulator [Escherichia coli]EGM7498795.1 hypothetical protein [Escherichia coli]EHP9912595.1 Rha family transcriptional regulator [Escherichia coli]EJN7742832.1 Rha family transcriptional regulator [Escherichia coli]ELE0722182.1 Rha family transcriptional regulator [Escherichia coli]MDC3453336.1 Rha family transcriptional regulator [Escherichia coli]
MNTVTTMNTAVKTASSVDLTAANDSVEKELSISTWRIAELMGRENRHTDIMRTVDRLVEAQIVTKPPVAFWSKTDRLGRKGKPIEVYLLTERDSYIVIAQTDPVYTAMLVDEWQRLKKENEELKNNAFPDASKMTEVDWIRKALTLAEEKEQLIDLHVRRAIDAHSLTRLLGEKRGSTKVQRILKGLCEAKHIERRLDASGKPCGYDVLPPAYMYARQSAHGQLEFTTDCLPVLVELGLIEEETIATLKLPQPNNARAIVNNTAALIRKNAGSLAVFGI